MNTIQIIIFTIMVIKGLYVFGAKRNKNVEINSTFQWILLALYFMVK